MDPTRTFCRINFEASPKTCREVITTNIKKISLIGKGQPQLIKNKDLIFTDINDIKDIKDIKDINNINDPFLTIDLYPFKNISAYNLASIDLYFNITDHGSGLIAPQLLKYQNYIMSGNNDIGMFEYIQYRNIMTFTYFLEDIPTNVNNTYINVDRMLEIKDYNKYRYIDTDFYITKILNIDPDGVDVYILQDYISDIELLTQLIIMIKTLKVGGDTIILLNMNDSISDFISDIILLLSNMFDSISLFKPCTLGLYNNKYYLIGKHYKQKSGSNNSPRGTKNSSIIISLLNDIIKRGGYTQNIDFILKDKNNQIVDYVSKIKEIIDDERITDKDNIYVSSKLRMYLNITS